MHVRVAEEETVPLKLWKGTASAQAHNQEFAKGDLNPELKFPCLKNVSIQ